MRIVMYFYVDNAPVNINPCPPPRAEISGALGGGGSQHFVSLLVNQVISKANDPIPRYVPGLGVRGFILTGT